MTNQPMQRNPSSIRAFLADHRDVYAKAAQALAQGRLPDYSPQEEQAVTEAFGFVANLEGGDGNIFKYHLQEPLFTNWMNCMNRALKQATNGQMMLALGYKDQGPGRIALNLVGGTEPLYLVLSTGAQPFQLRSDS